MYFPLQDPVSLSTTMTSPKVASLQGVWGWLGASKVTKDPSSFPEFIYGFTFGWNFERCTFPETNREFTPEYWWLKNYYSLLGGFLVGVKCYFQEVQVLKAILLVYWWYVWVCFMTISDCGLVALIFHVHGTRTVMCFFKPRVMHRNYIFTFPHLLETWHVWLVQD